MEEENKVIMEDSPNVITRTFLWMFMGLFATGLIAWFTYSSGVIEEFLMNGMFGLLITIELVVVLLFSFLFRKLSPTVVGILFFVYAAINGVGLSVIFAAFKIESIFIVFLASALLFAAFAFYGAKTKADISKISTLLFGTVFVCIIVSLINMFLGNSIIDIVISWVVLFVFFGITAYDMQNIKYLAQSEDPKIRNKAHIYGAMQLYLDFINIFVRILRIFGRSKD
ncbi:MAG: Bax inhibitor-1/YccA family protein [Clostridia bacterium]